VNIMLKITSARNPLIKEIKSLHRKKGRMKNNAFIIEGIKIINEAIENDYPIEKILYTDQLLENREGVDFLNRLQNTCSLIYVSSNVFKEISDTENPQGILAVAQLRYRTIDEIILENNPFLLYLDEVQDPGNMGTIIRTADAFNIDGIIISQGCVDPYNPKVVRATMGSIFRTPLYFASDGLDMLKDLREKGIKIYSTSLQGSIPIYDADYNGGLVLVIGNESKGVREDIQRMSNILIKIPMPGKAESLNAGVAASIIMYEVLKQRM